MVLVLDRFGGAAFSTALLISSGVGDGLRALLKVWLDANVRELPMSSRGRRGDEKRATSGSLRASLCIISGVFPAEMLGKAVEEPAVSGGVT
jgi:hypothetical protein